jgi:hypothetical protein
MWKRAVNTVPLILVLAASMIFAGRTGGIRIRSEKRKQTLARASSSLEECVRRGVSRWIPAPLQ